ncbi:S-layer homology domain-containing protein [Paenibacillus sp. MMS20-IR301]|uniref:S-layer homology domain-containing protein n=1 Tax=Paenibacillus sp. MMS20-IR301 TaxID=2895946 RepID=UPI0028E82F8A|nr:S-layer homology domain-containing protein [Paenibacillus sp. MMS20-IR301]WNS40748.1 S-layer homology domain-containing protein [Paenibacillus sp. MMS20-IR301]
MSSLFLEPAAMKAEAAPEVIPAVQDVFVSNFSGQGNSVGTSLNAAKLIYGKSRHVYLKFDLSAVDTSRYDIDGMNMTLSFRKSHSPNELIFTEAEPTLRDSGTEWTVTNVTYNNRPYEMAGAPMVTYNITSSGEQNADIDLSPIVRNALHSGRQSVSIHLTTAKVEDSTVSASELYSSRNTSGYPGPVLKIRLGDPLITDGMDRTVLSGLIAQANQLIETAYTADSWSVLGAALQPAKGLLVNNATQPEINLAVILLQAAMDSLVPAELPGPISGPAMGNYYNNSNTAAMIIKMRNAAGEYVHADPVTGKLSLTADASGASSFALYVLDYFATVDHQEAEAGATRTAYSIKSLENDKYLTIQNYFTADEFLNNTHRYFNIMSGAESGTSTERTFEIKAAASVPGWNERFYIDRYADSGYYRIWSHLSTLRDDNNFNRFNVGMTGSAMQSSGIAAENKEYKFYFEPVTDADPLEISQAVSGEDATLFWKPVNGDTNPAHYRLNGSVAEAVYSGGLMNVTLPGLSAGVHQYTAEYSEAGYQAQAEVNVRIFSHPGILLAMDDLERMRTRVQAKEEPWYSDYQRMLNTVSYQVAGSGYQNTVFSNVGRGGAPSDSANIGYFEKGGNAAYFNALQWVITGEEQYADKAADILTGWAKTLKVIDGRDRILGAGINAYKYASAAEILRYYGGGYNGYSQADFAALQEMMLNVVYPVIQDAAVPMLANGNWDAAAIVSMMAIGVLCDNGEIFDRAMHFYRDIHTNGSVFAYVNESGQTMETGRDQAHAMLALGYMAEICLIARNQDEDLASLYDNRLAKAFEYSAKYNLYSPEWTGEELPFTAMPNVFGDTARGYYGDGFDRDSNGLNRGELRPVFEQGLALYRKLDGALMTWTAKAAEAARPQGMVHFDNLNFGTLTHYDGEPLKTADGMYFQLRTRWEPLYQRNWSTVNSIKVAETLNSYYDINGNGELVTSVMKKDAPFFQLTGNDDGTYSVLLLTTNTYLSVKEDKAGNYNMLKADAAVIGENEKFMLRSSGVGPYYLVSPKYGNRIVYQEAAGSGSNAVLTLRLGTKQLAEITDVPNVTTNERLIFMFNTKEIAGDERTAPSMPQNLTAVAGDGQVALSWDAPASTGGAAIIKYEVSQDNGMTWKDAEAAAGHLFTGLLNGSEYTFAVRAVNNAGSGALAKVKAAPAGPVKEPEVEPVPAEALPGSAAAPVKTENAHIVSLNGVKAALTPNNGGGYSLIPTAEQIKEALGTGSGLVITVKDISDLTVQLPVSALGSADLTVTADFGSVLLSKDTLQNIKKKYGDLLHLYIRKGSFRIGLLHNGQPAAYEDQNHPLIITLPLNTEAGQDPAAFVVVRQEKENSSILPLAVAGGSGVTFTAAATGTYDVIYTPVSFKDVSMYHWAAKDITFTAARKLFEGTSGGVFSPGAAMTRAMFIQMLANLEGIDRSLYTVSGFGDVPGGQWYAAAVGWASGSGLISGTAQGSFSPDHGITREQLAVILYNYAVSKGYQLPDKGTVQFADGDSLSPWAEEAAYALASAGILNGKSGGRLEPGTITMRAETAAILARFIRSLSSN